ncbi:BMP family lipoprotein [Haloarchaeobius baliensis]|uniref:BMP family lipoprotein n=1 Tax=Haloarchaeobius baliensis TaxID=1670458 RepID=UPI003F881392
MGWNTRRRFVATAGAVGSGLLAGCTGTFGSGGGGGDAADGTDSRATTAAATSDATAVGVVYSLGGLGDKSFNDMANRGVQEARLDYDITYTNRLPQGGDEFGPLQRGLANADDPDYELVCCVGFSQADPLGTTAGEHPDQRFMIVDSVVEADNVASYVFREQEGSFQVGHLAGLLTSRELSAGAGETDPTAKTVGFVGGVDVPILNRFEAGFAAGARHADGDVEVLREYVGSFDDAAAGRTVAAEMYERGADIVYHAAGGSGIGVFEAAQEAGRFAIGVDSDQSLSDPRFANVILASMVKRVDSAVYTAVESVITGSYDGSAVVSLGLERQGLEVVYGDQIGDAIPDAVRDALAVSRQAIVDGDITVPTEPSDDGEEVVAR